MNSALKSLLAAWLLGSSALVSGAWTPAEGAVIHPVPSSKSRWVWAADKPVKDGAVARFRLQFDLPAPVKSAVIHINYDDSGFLLVNGSRAAGTSIIHGTWKYDIAKLVKKGKNLLAVQVKNGRGAAGMLLLGTITLVNGKTIYLHSSSDLKSVTDSADTQWYMPHFDDSKWQKSLELGDVIAPPWIIYRNLQPYFYTAAEFKAYQKRSLRSMALPAALGKEKLPEISITPREGMPRIKVGNEYLWPIFDLTGGGGNVYSDSWILRHNKLGIKIFQISLQEENFLMPDGTLSFERLDRGARRLIHLAPDAMILLQFRIAHMREFCTKYPKETMVFGTGPVDSNDELYGRPLRPSPASMQLRKTIEDWMSQMADFVKKQPWGNRVAAVRVSYGIYSEWHSFGMYQAPDLSQPMQKAFRAYLKKKYKNLSALRKAWNDPKVTFETASVPSSKERWGKDRFFRSPKQDAKELDFYDCYAHTHADLLLFMAKLAKEKFPGRLCGAYYGYALTNHPPEGATVLLDKVASSPYIDFLSSPPPYTAASRLAGGPYLSRGLASTLSRYGKLLFIEDDSRFHHIAKYAVKAITTRSANESRMTMRRNMFNTLFERCGIQFCDPIGMRLRRPGAFDDPSIDLGIKESLTAMEKALPLAGESGNEVAVIFNSMERLRHHAPPRFSKLNLGNLVNSHALSVLYRTGVPFDLMSHTDFLASKNKYKVYVFLNAFTNTAAERKAIREKIRRKGVTALFFNGAGYVTPQGFSAAAMEDLTGMKIAVDKKGKNSVLVFDNKWGRLSNNNRGIEERFIVNDPAAAVFARYAADKKAAAAEKTLADGSKVIYLGSYPQTAPVWRNLLSKAGAAALTAHGSYLRRHGNLIMFHTGKKALHKITLPSAYKGAVELFSGKKYTGRVISLKSEQDAGTWVFKCF
ncbi:MAG: hypothetical protein IKD44_00160 [Lentisphaeria bacterium]|nr:hypothetical protein [Lentisphaeria bacterium]